MRALLMQQKRVREILVDFLIVAGGGGGGGGCGRCYETCSRGTGGGGGGGVIYCEGYTLDNNKSYNVIVGRGGLSGYYNQAQAFHGEKGGDSYLGDLCAVGGGGGGGVLGYGNYNIGGTGGSGGGTTGYNTTGAMCGGCGTPGQGYDGGGRTGSFCAGGGGGGAGSKGCDTIGQQGGDGGQGVEYDISGANYYYSGGGAGATLYACISKCGYGGTPGCGGGEVGKNASNFGGGGGGRVETCTNYCMSGCGQRGVVYVRYPVGCNYNISGGTVYCCNGYKIHYFGSGDDLVVGNVPTATVDFLLIAGGGGGGYVRSGCSTYGGGGGGAGGMIVGCGTEIHGCNIVTIGLGGQCGEHGQDSRFGRFIAYGGGAGGRGGAYGVCFLGQAGGSGGGAADGYQSCCPTRGGTGIAGQGCDGGCTPIRSSSSYYTYAAGGGGAGGKGTCGNTCANAVNVGKGGIGRQNDFSGTNVYYAGGGAGGHCTGPQAACGGLGYDNCGGGGAGGNRCCACPGQPGVLIVRYPTDCGYNITGGDCCYECNGYCIHCFTSNGTLTVN